MRASLSGLLLPTAAAWQLPLPTARTPCRAARAAPCMMHKSGWDERANAAFDYESNLAPAEESGSLLAGVAARELRRQLVAQRVLDRRCAAAAQAAHRAAAPRPRRLPGRAVGDRLPEGGVRMPGQLAAVQHEPDAGRAVSVFFSCTFVGHCQSFRATFPRFFAIVSGSGVPKKFALILAPLII